MTAPEPAATPEPIIKVAGLSKRYGRTLALDAVDLTVPRGSLVGLLGPNGAGKTTLMHILCTIMPPDSGTATVAGYDVVRQPVLVRNSIGVAFQEPSLDDRLTAYENLDFHAMVYGLPLRSRGRRIADLIGLVELSAWSDRPVKTFSSGMKRRLELARALLHAPRILFLDEPTVGLDVQTRERIWGYLADLRRQHELTVVTSTHYIDEVENCDLAFIIDHGRILAHGAPAELRARYGSQIVRVVPRSAAVAAAIHAAYPQAVETTDGGLLISGAEPDLMDRFLSEFGTGIRNLAYETASLESVFLALTGRELRDPAAGQADTQRSPARRGGRKVN